MNINNDMLCGPPYGAALKRYTTSVRLSLRYVHPIFSK